MDVAVINLLIQVAFRFKEALFSPLMLIMLLVIGYQYWRLARAAIPERQWAIWVGLRLTLVAILSGIAIGVLGSLILVITGVNVAATGLVWLWLVALVLMLASPRYLCFAYAGGLVGMVNLLTGWPNMEVNQLMILIATLHLLEALLIYTVGARAAMPTFIRNQQGQVVGGFTLQQFWPLPLVAVISGNPAGVMPVFPAWWPLFASGAEALQLIGVLAVLGYAEITTTDSPVLRTHRSAINLMAYSLVLLILALLSYQLPGLMWLAVIFAPLGHELVIYLGLQREEQGSPRWAPVQCGVRLLWVIPSSPAQRAGLQSGDIINSIDGKIINAPTDLNQALSEGGRVVALVANREGQEMAFLLRRKHRQPIGILLIPEAGASGSYLMRPITWFHLLLPLRTHKTAG
ncbi:MAG: PDZ domain-containing protein [Methylocystaceae bacterium]